MLADAGFRSSAVDCGMVYMASAIFAVELGQLWAMSEPLISLLGHAMQPPLLP